MSELKQNCVCPSRVEKCSYFIHSALISQICNGVLRSQEHLHFFFTSFYNKIAVPLFAAENISHQVYLEEDLWTTLGWKWNGHKGRILLCDVTYWNSPPDAWYSLLQPSCIINRSTQAHNLWNISWYRSACTSCFIALEIEFNVTGN